MSHGKAQRKSKLAKLVVDTRAAGIGYECVKESKGVFA